MVLLAYNAESYLEEAIESALEQDFRDFELIVIDDGSTDGTMNIIGSYRDKRLKCYRNDCNRGIVYSRNRGIRHSSGKYIGMLDADDIAMPGKFRKQVEFLECNPDFGMVGSWASLVDENGKDLGENWRLPGRPEKIPPIMLFRNYFVQSAVIFRRDRVPEYLYKEGYEIVEDYKLWIDILKHSKAWNLPEYLVKYRIHTNNITKTREGDVKQNLVAVYKELLGQLGIEPTAEEIKLHHLIRGHEAIKDPKTFRAATDWLLKLNRENSCNKVFPRKEFAEVMLNRWIKLIWMSKSSDILFFLKFLNVEILTEYLVSRVYHSYA